jgi:transketolase C-terminal domain/subunit
LEIEAPAIVLVEAKRDSLNSGIGQCIAEMIAAQRFNQQNDIPIPTIYGATTSGTAWRFLKLEGLVVTIDLTDYALTPIDRLLGMLAWMVEKG